LTCTFFLTPLPDEGSKIIKSIRLALSITHRMPLLGRLLVLGRGTSLLSEGLDGPFCAQEYIELGKCNTRKTLTSVVEIVSYTHSFPEDLSLVPSRVL